MLIAFSTIPKDMRDAWFDLAQARIGMRHLGLLSQYTKPGEHHLCIDCSSQDLGSTERIYRRIVLDQGYCLTETEDADWIEVLHRTGRDSFPEGAIYIPEARVHQLKLGPAPRLP